MRTRRRHEAGFTLVELIIASLLFALICAGLAAIYATVFRQAGRILAENNIKNQAAVSMRAIQMELAQATSVSLPGPNGQGDMLQGCRNMRTNGTLISSSANAYGTFRAGCFNFCVKTTAGGQCTVANNNPPPCLYYYKPIGGGAWDFAGGAVPPGPAVPTCGNAVSGVTPELLASNLSNVTGSSNYFNRNAAEKANEGSAIRFSFVITKNKTATYPKLTYQVDSTVDLVIGAP